MGFDALIHPYLPFFLFIFTLGLSLHGLFTFIWMVYAWENPENEKAHKSPKISEKPKYSFTVLIPARNEGKVIKDTIKAVSRINYPENLTEILVLVRTEDTDTLEKTKEAILEERKDNIRIIEVTGVPVNKPHGLNQGLKKAKNRIITIFDAEDEPNPEIFNIVNTVLINEKVDVIQSGIQLMNYNSHWFSVLNVMEYFLWFKSGMHFFLKAGDIVPLGGNTVFFKKKWLKKVGGWDENCLTEDTDIGIRLILKGAKSRVIYDENHVTGEETPSSTREFIRQRTRWTQGYLQILLKGDWRNLTSIRQKMVILYILLSPLNQGLLFLFFPSAIWIVFTQKMPIVITLFSFIPLYLYLFQIIVHIIGSFEFIKTYKFRFIWYIPVKIFFTFFPYQLMLMFSSYRALLRVIFGKNAWEKTFHINSHRMLTY